MIGSHLIKSITKYQTVKGGSLAKEEKPSDEQIHKVLAFLANIARPATEVEKVDNELNNASSSCASSLRMSTGSNSFRNPHLLQERKWNTL